MTTTTRRAAIVDTRLAALWQDERDAQMRLAQGIDALHRANGESRERRRDWTLGPWPTSDDEAETQCRATAADPAGDAPYRSDDTRETILRRAEVRKAREAIGRVDADRAAIAACRAEAGPLEAEYREQRWSRFFLVTNTNGHVHRSMSCSTTFPTTQWAWLPDLSGLTEADAVESQGTRLCSVCYPSAPVEWTVGIARPTDPDRCPGGVASNRRRIGMRVYGSCPTCGRSVQANDDGMARAHKRPR